MNREEDAAIIISDNSEEMASLGDDGQATYDKSMVIGSPDGSFNQGSKRIRADSGAAGGKNNSRIISGSDGSAEPELKDLGNALYTDSNSAWGRGDNFQSMLVQSNTENMAAATEGTSGSPTKLFDSMNPLSQSNPM